MIAFLLWSFRDFESVHYTQSAQYDLDGLTRLIAWLMNSELFEQAWATVCSGPMNWWWSEKLCLFTVGYWTVFLATEGMSFAFLVFCVGGPLRLRPRGHALFICCVAVGSSSLFQPVDIARPPRLSTMLT